MKLRIARNIITNPMWTIPIVLIVLRLALVEARSAKAFLGPGGDTIIFRATRSVRLLYAWSLILFPALIVASVRENELWAVPIFGGLFLCCCFLWPSTLIIGESGLACDVWWRRRVAIPWEQVVGIEKYPGGAVKVIGKQQSIVFSPRHVDPGTFESQVKRRAGLQDVIDSEAPPSLRPSQ